MNVKYIKVVDNIQGYGPNCRGLSAYSENTIYVNSNTPSNAMLRSVIYHEFGHFADVSYSGFTLRDCYARSEEWKIACEKEANNLYSYYPGLSEQNSDDRNMEVFAMVFDCCYTNTITGEKADAKSICPELYNLICENFM